MQPQTGRNKPQPGKSIVVPLSGNVYPEGYYYAEIKIGQPPRPYFLDVDTGSDLTWLQCDAPCVKCLPAPHAPYKPNRNPVVKCNDPICIALGGIRKCQAPNDQCDYEISYADQSSSLGVVVRDFFSLTVAPVLLAFGCGYDQEASPHGGAHFTDGVLGLGRGQATVLSQLRSMDLMRNVIGHCFSAQGGSLFFGDDLVPNSGINWKPLLGQSNHYNLGKADLQFAGQTTDIRGLTIVFDSGSTYTYFTSAEYEALVDLIEKNIDVKELKVTAEDNTLPICWKRSSKPFKSIHDTASYFKRLTLTFKDNNVQFPLDPEDYLIVSEHGNVCLGILDGGKNGLGNINLIGDISFQDKLVIYDNEKQLVGWRMEKDCKRFHKAAGGNLTRII